MNLQDHIEYIRNRCIDAIARGDEMNSAIFEDGHGLIMTFNEAIEIVNEIDRLKAEKAELLEALKKIRGVEVWIQDREMKELFQKIVYSAIKNAEKKQQ